jgi:DNA-directed RNA polymerase specialized sigma24 family protein
MVKQGAPHESEPWAAFEGEVLPHADRLFRLAMWFERNRADAEDVVQETMMQALRARRKPPALFSHLAGRRPHLP